MRYNYFDDDEENEARENLASEVVDNIKYKLNPRNFTSSIKNGAENILSGNVVKPLSEFPNIRNFLLKFLAFILFIILVIVSVFGFAYIVDSQNEMNAKFSSDAGKVCTDLSVKYGAVKWEKLDSDTYGKDMARVIGLSYARQMDFNNDGSSELMVCYSTGVTYILEVYGYVDGEFVSVYSNEANSTTDAKDGSWISFYHHNNKYYICKSDKEKPYSVGFYSFNGKEFSSDGGCDYDYVKNIYSMNGEINATDFETIKLSMIKSSKAERITETVADNLEAFSSFSVASLDGKKSEAQLKNEAYYSIIQKKITQYGKPKKRTKDGVEYIEGVAYVALIDFNNDNNDELVLGYRKNLKQSATNYYNGDSIIIEVPTYCMEIYTWNGSSAKRIFSKDSVSNYLSDENVNYIMFFHTSKKVSLCVNRYSYENMDKYTATSRIYDLKKGKFDSTFEAKKRYSYGYSDYYINSEYTYSDYFESNGKKVPLFLDDNGKVDASKYTVIYLSGKKNYEYQNVINDTVRTIQSINSSYLNDD